MKTDGNDMAYPSPSLEQPGLSIREYFAGLAMQGILAANSGQLCIEARRSKVEPEDAVARTSVFFADALIAALNEEVSK